MAGRKGNGGGPSKARSSTQRIVSPNPGGGWRVDAPGARRASTVKPTKQGAEQRAKEIVRKEGGGEVRFRDSTGRFVDSDTVAPGRDPFPPRDKKH